MSPSVKRGILATALPGELPELLGNHPTQEDGADGLKKETDKSRIK